MADCRSHERGHILQGGCGVAKLLAEIDFVKGFPGCVARQCGGRRACGDSIVRVDVCRTGVAVLMVSLPAAARSSRSTASVGGAAQGLERCANVVCQRLGCGCERATTVGLEQGGLSGRGEVAVGRRAHQHRCRDRQRGIRRKRG